MPIPTFIELEVGDGQDPEINTWLSVVSIYLYLEINFTTNDLWRTSALNNQVCQLTKESCLKE